MKLNDKNIRKSRNTEYLWDDDLPGFGVRHYKNKSSYVVRHYKNDIRRIETIGSVGLLSIEQARELAREKLLTVLGFKLKANESRLFSEVSSDYMELISMRLKRSWEDDLSMLRSRLLPAFHNKAMGEITKREIDAWHKRIPYKYSANRCLALLSTIYNKAIDWGDCKENPCKGVTRNKEVSRDHFIDKNKYDDFLRAVELEKQPYPSIIKLLILTGLRKHELLDLKWDDVDLQSGMATIKHTKNGSPHVIPLSDRAVEIFKSIPKKYKYIFIMRGKKLENIKYPWQRIRENFGDKTLKIHDLRRTFGSWLAQDGVSLQIIGELLNHKDPKTTMIYARLQKEHLRKVVEKIQV